MIWNFWKIKILKNLEILEKSENFPKNLKSENLCLFFVFVFEKIWKSEKSWNFLKKLENLKNM